MTVRLGSIGLFWGADVGASVRVYLWDAKGSELYMLPLIQQLRDKGIPLTAEPLGFQQFDGWTCCYQSRSLLQQLLQTDPDTHSGQFYVLVFIDGPSTFRVYQLGVWVWDIL